MDLIDCAFKCVRVHFACHFCAFIETSIKMKQNTHTNFTIWTVLSIDWYSLLWKLNFNFQYSGRLLNIHIFKFVFGYANRDSDWFIPWLQIVMFSFSPFFYSSLLIKHQMVNVCHPSLVENLLNEQYWHGSLHDFMATCMCDVWFEATEQIC